MSRTVKQRRGDAATRRHGEGVIRRAFVFCLLPLAFALSLSAAVLPEHVGSYNRVSVQPVALTDKALWDEYGLQQSEAARYESGKQQFTLTAYRLQDPTGAFAVFKWRHPADGKPSKAAKLAVETPAGLVMAHGNYLLEFAGYKPEGEELARLIDSLRLKDESPFPNNYLPSGVMPGSERYILGPAALERFDSRIPPSAAGFHQGGEVQLASYKTSGGEAKLAVFSYPTHQIAMLRVEDLQKIPGAMVKRSGPLIGVMVSPPDRDAAEKLLAQVKYQASVTLSEHVPTKRDNIGDLIINAFTLIGILLGFTIVGGLGYAGIRILRQRNRKDDDVMTVLSLSNRK